eukprot:TRINITY_DN36360_c1_g1_i1.p1 TRINITY_DN36360_c1_g1~~TRINITY_DN36360_c1_g1_i1.p1  ORF type:complete len:1142 (+),score=297.80 TRINITY_DN36360_c1_g1_i1:109-3534(+)
MPRTTSLSATLPVRKEETNRFVCLHDLQVKYGELTRDANKPHKPSSPDSPAPKKRGRKSEAKGATESDALTTSELITKSPTFVPTAKAAGDHGSQEEPDDETSQIKAVTDRLRRSQASHERCLASLRDLKCFETELDLTYHSVINFSPDGALPAPPPSSKQPVSRRGSIIGRTAVNSMLMANNTAASTAGAYAASFDEVIIEMEFMPDMHGSMSDGRAKKPVITLRSPQTWEMQLAHGGAAIRSHTPVSPSAFVRRRSSLALEPLRRQSQTAPINAETARRHSQVRPLGSALTEPRLRSQSKLKLDRDASPCSGDSDSDDNDGHSEGSAASSLQPCPTPLSPAASALPLPGPIGQAITLQLEDRLRDSLVLKRKSGTTKTGEALKAQNQASALKLEALFCRRIEEEMQQEAAAAAAALEAEEEEALAAKAKVASAHPTGALGGTKLSLKSLDPRFREARERASNCLRDFRAALRLLGPSLPAAGRVVEGAVKALVTAFDVEISTLRKLAVDLEGQVASLTVNQFEVEALKQQTQMLRRNNSQLQNRIDNAESKHLEELRTYFRQMEVLKDELQRITPDASEIQGLAGLMADYGKLMGDMEEECSAQTRILSDLTKYTTGVLKNAGGNPSAERSIERGRVVEMTNGEILLRAHDVAEAASQVAAADLCGMNNIDPHAPIRVRAPRARELLTMFEGQDLPEMAVDALCHEVEQIFCAKISAGDADTPEDLLEFVIKFYIDELGSVSQAQQKLCSILRCLLKAERNPVPPPAKVSLFARLIMFCEHGKEMPIPVLQAVLEAKRFAQVFAIQKFSVLPDRRRTVDALKERNANEVLLAVAPAYEAAEKAMPMGGNFCGLRELFASISRATEAENPQESRKVGSREFLVFLHLAHACLAKESAPSLRQIIRAAEQKAHVPVDDFRAALREMKLHAVEEHVWRQKMTAQGMSMANAPLSPDLLLDYFGGGSASRLPKCFISETALLSSVIDAMVADYDERSLPLRRLWERRKQERPGEQLRFVDFKGMMLSANPDLNVNQLRTIYLEAVEASRACTQIEADVVPVFGTMEDVEAMGVGYGGDTLTWEHLRHAALTQRLFLSTKKDAGGPLKFDASAIHRGETEQSFARETTSRSARMSRATTGRNRG